ncbi:hypothetical protein AMC77_01000 [Candidatus Profftella armatura]|nr:hypothetical protein AMC77_01000 [Candidatus Profftella armatura]
MPRNDSIRKKNFIKFFHFNLFLIIFYFIKYIFNLKIVFYNLTKFKNSYKIEKFLMSFQNY